MMRVNNLPEYAKKHNYLVCREVNNELWFWGAFDDHDRAFKTAMEICGGVVVLPWLAVPA